MQPTQDRSILREWIGRRETHRDTVALGPTSRMEMTLDRDPVLAQGDALPPLWHWLYFLQTARIGNLGRDGHPARGGFLPPVALPRRMWAGSRFGFATPLRIGDIATRTSTIKDVTLKQGRSGALCFVTVHHAFDVDGTAAFWEEHDIVYREDPAQGETPVPTGPVGTDWDVTERITPSEVLLFRYSALTFNGHRIHYDRAYAREVEGHAGLVVHGPLLATLLVDLAQRTSEGAAPRSFTFRAHSPLFDTAPFTLHAGRDGDATTLAAATPGGQLAMQATATF